MRWIMAMAFAAACGGGSAMPDAAIPIDSFPTAPHTPYPQVPDQGGPKLAHPQLVTVTFANDAHAATFEAFAQWIVGSSWLATVGAEYGIGAGAVTGVAHRPETPPPTQTSTEIEMYLAAGVMDGSIPRPSSLADALYIVYYPATTAITATFVNGIMKHSCSDFGGYHGEVHQNGLDFAYTAIPECGGAVPGLSAVETIELVVSHEVIEAATDARPITAPALQLHADPTDPWFGTFVFEVELGDMCEEPSRFVREAGFVAQRSWSNAAAAAGGEPCLPVDPALPAFGVTATPGTVQRVSPGGSVDFTLAGWSTGTTPPWTLMPILTNSGTITATRTRFTLDASTLDNGGTTTIHVTVPAGAPVGSHPSIFVLSQHTAEDATMWPLSLDVE